MGDVGCWQEMLHLCGWTGGMSSAASLQRMKRRMRGPLKRLFDDYAEVPAGNSIISDFCVRPPSHKGVTEPFSNLSNLWSNIKSKQS